MLDRPASLQSVQYCGPDPEGPGPQYYAATTDGSRGRRGGDAPWPGTRPEPSPTGTASGGAQGTSYTPTCLSCAPPGGRPGSPANVLQRLRCSSIVIRCTPGLSSPGGHITERYPCAGHVAHRLDRLEAFRGGPERLLGL